MQHIVLLNTDWIANMTKIFETLFKRTPKKDPEAEAIFLQSQLAMNLRMQRVMAAAANPSA